MRKKGGFPKGALEKSRSTKGLISFPGGACSVRKRGQHKVVGGEEGEGKIKKEAREGEG